MSEENTQTVLTAITNMGDHWSQINDEIHRNSLLT